ncbi:radical SAM protein [Pseudodesulfovibrio sp. zrk46]|uniref:radical SAM protein n=1 Tax=Pseudodesulfovibrio sp. zrk46 TaxID=2725288 RepID=UPI001448F13E|nr:radical SAM protein [Pseudodesulfovibrio sp. zrk46]QJB56786.1 radical SAM protein [Pseudodesulfovibrio sp. zrk46]
MTNTATSYANHPCFGMSSRKETGRLHLPVAPRSNAKIRFEAVTKTKPAMMPEEAVNWLVHVLDAEKPVRIVGITGPGDPLASPDITIRTLRMIRERYPKMDLCLTTLGIGGAMYVPELAEIGISHVTVLVDAVTPEVAEKLYAWIRPGKKTVPLTDAAKELMDDQKKTITAFKDAGITVKVNTTVYPGFNAGHVEDVAEAMASLGVDIMAVVPFHPADENCECPASSTELMTMVRDRAARHINLMPSWDECGEGLVGLDTPEDESDVCSTLPKPTPERPNVAVTSASGMDVDIHLGHAAQILIYGPREDGLACLLETREASEPGSGAARWKDLATRMHDCFAVLTAGAGDKPKEILSRSGVTVIVTNEGIEGTVDVLYGGKKKGKCRK